MSEIIKVYDYTSVMAKSYEQELFVSIYESFGWEKTTKVEETRFFVNLMFRRRKDIENKEILQTLEKKCTKILSQISKMQSQKRNYGVTWALCIGFCAVLAFGVAILFLLSGSISLSVPFFVVGTGFCIPPYFVYLKKMKQKTKELEPVIDEKYAELDSFCQEARSYLKKV